MSEQVTRTWQDAAVKNVAQNYPATQYQHDEKVAAMQLRTAHTIAKSGRPMLHTTMEYYQTHDHL